jgi:DNA repair exonuclease SbcCD nuclease subunit
MKIALITDQHFGARNDSIQFLDYYQKFYLETFIPRIKEEGIKQLLILGDTFDRRKYVNFYTLKRTKEMFFDPLAQLGVQIYMLAGNHDTYFKNTNEVNSIRLLLQEYNNITVIDKPSHIWMGEDDFICMMPWICPENYEESMDFLNKTEAKICCGHFEIEGFAMYRGMPSHEGLKRALFRKFEFTFSGHYHHKSSSDGINYLGNPYELTWQDYNDPRGYHILDLDDRSLSFVENPNRMFYRVTYDDKEESITEITNKDLTGYKDKYIKVVVVNKTNPFLFDRFMERMYEINPADVTIVEDMSDLTEGVEEEMIDQAEDTLTVLNKFVDSIKEDGIDNGRLKNIIRELYVEALNLEKV